jgi:hypothetical protein
MKPVSKFALRGFAVLAIILVNCLLFWGNAYAYSLLPLISNIFLSLLLVSLFYAITIGLLTKRFWRDGLLPALVITGVTSACLGVIFLTAPFRVLELLILGLFAVGITFLFSLLLAASGKWNALRALLPWYIQLLAMGTALVFYCSLAIT